MTIGAFIVHLARAEQRRRQVEAIQKAIPLAGKIIDAVDGSSLSESEVAAVYRADLHMPNYPFPLKRGEIGCFLSHREAWKAIVEGDLAAGLVIEDDVEVDPPTLRAALDLASGQVARHGVIQFQVRDVKKPGPLVARDGAFSVHLPVVTPLRTACSLYGADAARRFLELSERFDRPIDVFVQMHWLTGIRAGVVIPSGVREVSGEVGGSTIQTSPGKQRRGVAETLRREVGRFVYRRRVASLSRRAAGKAEKTLPAGS